MKGKHNINQGAKRNIDIKKGFVIRDDNAGKTDHPRVVNQSIVRSSFTLGVKHAPIHVPYMRLCKHYDM